MFYSAGETLPYDIRLNEEGIHAVVDDSFLLACVFKSVIRPDDIRLWRSQKITCRTVTHESICFLNISIADFNDFYFRVNLKGETPQKIKEWNEVSDRISLLLCDFPSKIIKAIRVIEVNPSVMREFKENCMRSSVGFKTDSVFQQRLAENRFPDTPVFQTEVSAPKQAYRNVAR